MTLPRRSKRGSETRTQKAKKGGFEPEPGAWNSSGYYGQLKNTSRLTRDRERELGQVAQRALRELFDLTEAREEPCPKLSEVRKLIEKRRRSPKSVRLVSIERLLKNLDRLLELIKKDPAAGPGLRAYRLEALKKREELQQAVAELTTSNLRLAVATAKNFKNRGLDLNDLIQEANIGLMKAAVRFDPESRNRFSTYAVHWIRQALHQAVQDQGRCVRVPSKAHKNNGRLAKARENLRGILGREPSLAEAAAEAGLSEDRARKLQTRFQEEISLDAQADGERPSPISRITDKRPGPESRFAEVQFGRLTLAVLNSLEERERRILGLRYGLDEGEGYTLAELAGHFGVSRERIRQLEKRALAKMRERLENMDGRGERNPTCSPLFHYSSS